MFLFNFCFFFDFKRGVSAEFSSLFGEFDRGADGGGVQGDTEEDKKIEEETINSKWGWYAILCNIADNNFLDIEEITKKNFKECLTYISYMSDYNKEQEKKINGRINT